jgi:hypothetical protein
VTLRARDVPLDDVRPVTAHFAVGLPRERNIDAQARWGVRGLRRFTARAGGDDGDEQGGQERQQGRVTIGR